jgi:hypothetical protein
MKRIKLGIALAAVIALMVAVPANASPRQDAKERRQALESIRTPDQIQSSLMARQRRTSSRPSIAISVPQALAAL